MKRQVAKHLGKLFTHLPFFIASTLAVPLCGQVHEFGINGGVLNYTGDLSTYYDPLEFQPGGQVFYRYNRNKATSYRIGVLYGLLGASDAQPYDPLAEARNFSFQRDLLEVDALVEYHFLDYKDANSLIRWSPYFFTGIGAVWLPGNTVAPDGTNYSPVQAVIPLGMGLKWQMFPRLSLNVDLGGRITFTDYLDNVSGREENVTNKDFLFGQWNVRDVFYYTGISICYTLYTIQCPYDYE